MSWMKHPDITDSGRRSLPPVSERSVVEKQKLILSVIDVISRATTGDIAVWSGIPVVKTEEILIDLAKKKRVQYRDGYWVSACPLPIATVRKALRKTNQRRKVRLSSNTSD